MASLYRQRAIDSLSSPEELDRRTRVTRPWAWLILAAAFALLAGGIVWALVADVPVTDSGVAFIQPRDGVRAAVAPIGGTVALDLHEGDRVTPGQRLARVTDPLSGTSVDVRAASAGTIAQTLIRDGEVVAAGGRIALVLPEAMELYARIFVPYSERAAMADQEVLLAPAGYPTAEYGYLKARVVEVGPYAVTQERLFDVLQNREIQAQVNALGPVAEILAQLEPDASTPSGYAWTTSRGPSSPLPPSSPATAEIILRVEHPVDYLFGRGG